MGSRRVSKTRTALRAVIFVLIAVLGIGLISPAFVVNNEWDMRHVHGFFLEPEGSLDVVLIGLQRPARVAGLWLYKLSAGRVEHPRPALRLPAHGGCQPPAPEAHRRGYRRLPHGRGPRKARGQSPQVARQYALVAQQDRDHPHLRACGAADLVLLQHRKIPCQLVPAGHVAAGAAASARDGQDRLLAHEEL